MTRSPAAARALSALLFLLVCLAPRAASAQVCATPGKDGPATLTGVVNTYFPGSASAASGATSVTVGAARVGGASTGITEGDLLLVVQMQDANIDSSNNSRYGDGVNGGVASGSTNLNSTSTAGFYEYVVALNNVTAAGGTIQIRGASGGGLINAYTNAAAGAQGQRRFQVVRVPQYSSATLTSGLTAAPWDGATGGILAIDVSGALNLNSAVVSVTGRGFRGGAGRMLGGATGQAADDRVVQSSTNTHGSKAEGIAGTPRYTHNSVSGANEDNVFEGLPGGSYARGAPANAGGGGTDSAPALNEENSGGGGGANGGAGGQGGNTWRTNAATGGYGGVGFPGAAARVALGGGGGAGTRNNSPLLPVASSGSSGGGIVMVRAGTVAGAGDILADGADAYQATLNDGGGGGGAGGSVVVVAASGGLGGLRVFARGGRGGDAWRNQPANGTPGERHGPGGGGGGGVVLTSSAATVNVNGGASGVTTQALDPYGATAGSNGTSSTITAASIPGASMGAQCFPTLTTVKTTSTATVNNTASGTTATYSILVSNAANRGAAFRVAISDTLPSGFTYASTGSVTFTGTASRTSTTNPTSGDAVPQWSEFRIPGGSSVRITFTVGIAAGTNGTFQNPATAFYADPVRTVDATNASASYNSASSTGEDVTVIAPPRITLVKSCTSPANCETSPGGHRPGTELTYTIVFSNTGGRPAQNVFIVDVIPFTVDLANSVNVRTTDFKVGSMTFTPNTSTLTLPAAGIRHFSDALAYPATPPWTPSVAYTPAGAAGTFDPAVTYVGWQFNGTMPPNTSGTVTFTVRIR